MFNQTYPGQQYAEPYDYGDGSPKGPEIGLEGSARTSFIKKVYLLLSLQLLVTAILVLFSMYSPAYKSFVGNSITIIVASVGLLVVGLVMACCFEAARPFQVPLFIIFTILEAILVSAVTAFTSSKIVALAALMAFALVVVLTIYACTNWLKYSYDQYGLQWVRAVPHDPRSRAYADWLSRYVRESTLPANPVFRVGSASVRSFPRLRYATSGRQVLIALQLRRLLPG
jgi:hypothetical protein